MYERISEEFITYRQRVIEALLFISEFITEIPSQYSLEDGSYVGLDEVQDQFQSVVHSCNPVGGRIGHILMMSAKFEKAANEVEDFLRSVADTKDILEKRCFAIDGIDAPNWDTISIFLADVIEL